MIIHRQIAYKKTTPYITLQYRSYNTFNEEQFLSDMSETMTILNVSPIDPDKNFQIFIQTFMTVFDKHTPIKAKRVKKETQPEWHNDKINTASKERDMYHKSRTQYKYSVTGEIKR